MEFKNVWKRFQAAPTHGVTLRVPQYRKGVFPMEKKYV